MAYFPPPPPLFFFNFFFFVLVNLLLLLLSSSSLHAGTRVMVAAADLLNQVCNKTTYPGFCLAAFRNDDRTAKADLIGLGHIAVDLTLERVTITANKIKKLIGQTNDPDLKGRLNDCAESYALSILDCQNAHKDLNTHFYRAVNLGGQAISENAEVCEKGFSRTPSFPSPLTINNQVTMNLAQIIGVISRRLGGN